MKALIAKTDNKYRIDIKDKRFLVESIKDKALLLTVFNELGEIEDQLLFNPKEFNPELIIVEIMKGYSIDSFEYTEYTEIKLIDKSCPVCGSSDLIRISEISDYDKIPIMPLYACSSCNSRLYYLTDSYLIKLVERNNGLFTENEINEYRENREAFLNELKEYISRFFASKKVYRIK
ncbi:MAG: hypothetical protein ARM1_0183 [Candidatus Micrarchaeota archaeon]|nr:MAG: hypothetical protein ARM1_0183 [Candidatus Micrarchaeota archaeon]